jgi:uncharacterized membrane protein (DUF485 family)
VSRDIECKHPTAHFTHTCLAREEVEAEGVTAIAIGWNVFVKGVVFTGVYVDRTCGRHGGSAAKHRRERKCE